MKSLFFKSFKELNNKFIYIILADFGFLIALVLIFLSATQLLSWSIGTLHQIPAEALDLTKEVIQFQDIAQFEQGMQITKTAISQFKSRIIISLAAFWALIVISTSLFKGIAWGVVKKQKLNKKYFKQFFKLNFCWLAGITLLLILAFIIARQSTAIFLILLISALAGYLLSISYAVFNPNKKITELFTQTFYLGVGKFYYFIIPITLSIVFLLIVLIILSILRLILPQMAGAIIALLFFIIWQSWFKYYIHLIVKSIK